MAPVFMCNRAQWSGFQYLNGLNILAASEKLSKFNTRSIVFFYNLKVFFTFTKIFKLVYFMY